MSGPSPFLARVAAPIFVGLVAALTTAAVAAESTPRFLDDPHTASEVIAASNLDVENAVDASGLTLDLGRARLELSAGVLIPVRLPDRPQPLEWVFRGKGTLEADSLGHVEDEQLAYFVGSRKLKINVQQAVLLPGTNWIGPNPQTLPRLEQLSTEDREAAAALFLEWSDEAERAGFGADTALIRALLGDPTGLGFAGAWLDARGYGRLFWASDPGQKEPVSFGQYRLFELSDFLTRRQQKRQDRWRRWRTKRDAEEGRAIEGEAEEIPCGHRDDESRAANDTYMRMVEGELLPWVKTWITAPAAGADPSAEPPGFEAKHYRIDLELEGDELEAEGSTLVRLVANADGLRVVTLDLGIGMDVCEVEDEQGRSLPFQERDSHVLVALAEPTVAGESQELFVRIAGRPVRHLLGRRTLKNTIRWHPHVGRMDRATYDVTLRWPESLKLVSSGTRTDGGAEPGQLWERRVLNVPAIGFSFEVDEFEIHEEIIGHVALRFAFLQRDQGNASTRAEIMTATKAALLYFESHLGLLPIHDMTVVLTDRGFSQGMLGFLTLTEGALHALPPSLFDNRSTQEIRLETIAHEMAHQWWGNMVGWESYRDQWLSEALATFSASQFMTTIAETPGDYLRRASRRRQTTLAQQTASGRPLASVGSVLLGGRLAQNYGSGAYHAIVYDKGAAVFSTLAERLGREPSWQMLGSLTRAVNNRVIRTETFFRALERMSGRDLTGFGDQFIRGSGVPVVFHEWEESATSDGGWLVRGSARQMPPAQFRYAVVRTESGLDVQRRFDVAPDLDGWEVALPFLVDTSDGEALTGTEGTMTVRGTRSEFSIPTPLRPRRLVLDPEGSSLVALLGGRSGAAGSLFQLGEHLQQLGRFDECAEVLGRALAATGQSAETERLAVRIRLALARLHLDRDNPDGAANELRAIDRLLPDDSSFYRGERELLTARLEVRRGRLDDAADTLHQFINTHAIELNSMSADRLLDPEQATALRFSRGEMLALLALVERQRGRADADLLIRMANLVGVDMRIFGGS